MSPSRITGLTARDIRFPTTLHADGSDAVHDPDYSCVYVTLETDDDVRGYGITFTVGRGNELVMSAVMALRHLVVGRHLHDIFDRFADYWRELTQEPQLRWLGPEKGVTHLATAAIVNALWDLWARIEKKPLWRLLVDMEPEKLLSTLNFKYISDVLTEGEALEILKKGREGRQERAEQLLMNGYPAYTTSAGWLGYTNETVTKRCRELLQDGFTRFKVKVGSNQEDDARRLALVRKEIGPDNIIMTDANQRWDVQEAIDWMKPLAKYKIHWIEEPTSPDDILGHKAISEALAPYGIGVATGEHCQNRVMFKQFIQSGAFQFCQIDSCRLGGPNEIIPVLLMAAKYGIPVCPHAGGVGLCELVHHYMMFDYCCITRTMENRVIEYVDHLHEHFVDPTIIRDACYMPAQKPGFSCEMKPESLEAYEYPNGSQWRRLFEGGKFQAP